MFVLEPKKEVKGSVMKVGFKNPEIIEARITLGSSIAVFIPVFVAVEVWADTLSANSSGITVS